ncbi:Phospholipase Carboxylesterase superfamily [Seminavis robusta]|uniref:Phospholipase Carboxylesterase superfamily n=1 Tax=Seminavis robusta TaxID=568900 RepID=A0A9N8DQ51_9STRA|nr:Phospholipase Carboxylesterase superfamily [Seminavis robusta]|eukprot:Sro205_g086250.1 Phospholipase Carboxylesterase superfamily (223) ;mRNA; r:46696-47364
MTRCDLCGTQKGETYGSIYDVGMVCHRCSLLSMAGAEMAMMPHCPKVPDDIDPEVLSIQQRALAREPLTAVEYEAWVESCGNPTKGRLKVMEIFAEKKIERWFEDHGGSVQIRLSPDPIPFELLRACAMKHPPTSQVDIPGISVEMAKAVIQSFRVLILVLHHHPDMGEIANGVFVGHECDYCGKVLESIRRCSRCKKKKYCNRDCQKSHWREHKKVCQPAK